MILLTWQGLSLQDSNFRMLPVLGIAAVGCASSTAFTQLDADRFTALSQLTPTVPELLEPLPASQNPPGPLGPICHNILPSQHPSTGLSARTERYPHVCCMTKRYAFAVLFGCIQQKLSAAKSAAAYNLLLCCFSRRP